MADFDNIHYELIGLIMEYLNPEDLASFRLVCLSFKNTISAASVLQPLYNRLYEIDKTLPPQIDPKADAFLVFKNAFEQVRSKQDEEIAYLADKNSMYAKLFYGILEKGTESNFSALPTKTIEDLQRRDFELNQINISRINAKCNFSWNTSAVLDLSGSNLTRFIVPEDKQDYFSTLESIDLDRNQLTTLNLNGCPALQYLNCNQNKLTTLTVDKCPQLETVVCRENKLTTLNLNNNPFIKEVYCQDNTLINLFINKCTALKILNCDFNQLTTLILDECDNLQKLQCIGNQLSILELSKNCAPVLKSLQCTSNKLIILNLGGFSALTEVNCSYNHLHTLIVDHCVNLSTLILYINPLTALSFKECAAVQKIDPVELLQLNLILELNLEGASPALQKLFSETEEKILFAQLCSSTFSERVDIIRRLDVRYNMANCFKYRCAYDAGVIAHDLFSTAINRTFLPSLLGSPITEEPMDEDRQTNNKRERPATLDQSEEPRFKKHKNR